MRFWRFVVLGGERLFERWAEVQVWSLSGAGRSLCSYQVCVVGRCAEYTCSAQRPYAYCYWSSQTGEDGCTVYVEQLTILPFADHDGGGHLT